MVTQLPVFSGEEVVSFFMIEQKMDSSSLCHADAMWTPIPVPIYGKYDDYGAVEDFTGEYDELLEGWFKGYVIELEQGENPYHDTPVKRDAVTMEYLYKADHDDRLWTRSYRHTAAERRALIHHAVIRRSIFEAILAEFKLSHYARDANDQYYTKHTSFADVAAEIPIVVDEWLAMPLNKYGWHPLTMIRHDRDNRHLFTDLLPTYGVHAAQFELFNVITTFYDREHLIGFLTEYLKFIWLNQFIVATRKHWSPQTGAGSQAGEFEPYKLLSKFMMADIEAAELEWNEEFDDDPQASADA